jgi:protein-S-isoprenylcysteine O-methyltransferase Ste14
MRPKTILPPTFFNSAALLSIAICFVFPAWRFIHYPLNLLGFVLVVVGGVLNIWTDQIFKKANTTVKPFEKPSMFITSGPFRLFRHPMYFGMLIILVGISIVCGSIMSLVGPLCFWIIIRVRFIPREEESMSEIFGNEYNEYRKRVSCWM